LAVNAGGRRPGGCQGLLAGGDVGHLAQGLGQGAVIGGHGAVAIGLGAAQAGAQAAALEDRQAHGRADAADVRAAGEQLVEMQRLHADGRSG
jgi:hypothetical protein